MAPLSPLPNLRRSPHLPAPPLLHCGASTARASLAKIIAVISTVRPPAPPPRCVQDSSGGADPDQGARPPTELIGLGGVDLSLRLGSLLSKEIVVAGEANSLAESVNVLTVEKSSLILPPASAEQSVSSEASVAGGVAPTVARSSEGECDPEEEQEHEDEEDGEESDAQEVALIEKEAMEEESMLEGGGKADPATTTITSWWRRGCRRPEGYLDMLLDAIRKISGPFPGEETDPRPASKPHSSSMAARRSSTTAATAATRGERNAKRKEPAAAADWIPYGLYDEAAPIVRSKRGRSQALPSRYRDSVLEPWRKPPTVCRHPKRN